MIYTEIKGNILILKNVKKFMNSFEPSWIILSNGKIMNILYLSLSIYSIS